MKTITQYYDATLDRVLEITFGSVSFFLITFPIWGSVFWPEIAAYFIILFDVYWLYKSATLAFNATRGYLAIQRTTKIDWGDRVERLQHFSKLRHIVFIPTVNEPIEILRRTLTFLADQEFDTSKIAVVLATEAKAVHQEAVALQLREEFRDKLGPIWVTVHQLKPGEVVGKSSNLAHAGAIIEQEIERLGWDKDFVTATSCDADVGFHTKYFAYFGHQFLSLPDPERHLSFWQAPILFYNNIWRLPMPLRVLNTIYSIGHLDRMMRPQSNYNYSSYSLSWKLLEGAGYWDVDVIPEDWHLFFKSFFSHHGLVELRSLTLPIYADAAEGGSLAESVRINYVQIRRWAWGITDLTYALKMYLTIPGIPFGRFIFRYLNAVEHHALWPVNFFILTFGATIPTLINPAFKLTSLGFGLPGISGTILTFALIGLLSVIILDILIRPPRPQSFRAWRLPFTIIQYIFLPLTAFLFGALPGMDAHMRLILGKRLEYKVTEKKV